MLRNKLDVLFFHLNPAFENSHWISYSTIAIINLNGCILLQQVIFNRDFFTFDFDITPIKSYFTRGKLERIANPQQIINEELHWLMLNSDPKATLTILSPETSDQLWDQADKIAAVVVTIGKKPESKIKELFDNNQLERGLILDTLASVFVEFCAQQVYKEIEVIARSKCSPLSGRITPGGIRGEIDLSYQDKLLRLVDHESIGVTITSGMMMIPAKSTSFFTLIGSDIDTKLGCGNCHECPVFRNCDYSKFGLFNTVEVIRE